MAEIVVKYQEILDAIDNELQIIWSDLKASTSPEIVQVISNVKKIEVADEQMFIKDEETKLDPKTLYVTVKFGEGPANFGSTVSPVFLTCLGTANQVKPAQLLLSSFASTWNAKNLNQGLINTETQESLEVSDKMQVWNTPEVISNFNVYRAEFRNLYRLRGNIVIGPSAVRLGTLTYYFKNPKTGEDDEETINFMAFHDGYHASLDSQPFMNTYGFVESEVNFSTYTFSISTYLLDNQLSADMLAVRGFRNRRPLPEPGEEDERGYISKFSANKKIQIKLTFNNGFTNIPEDNDSMLDSDDPVKNSPFFGYFKVVDSQIGQELAGLPSLTITFTR